MNRDGISSAIEASRDELLDLGLRNPLLNYRTPRARGVEVVDELPVEVFRTLVREHRAMTFAAVPEGDTETEGNELLVQPGDEDGDDDGPAARHVDLQLQTNLTSTKLQSRLIKTERMPGPSSRSRGSTSCTWLWECCIGSRRTVIRRRGRHPWSLCRSNWSAPTSVRSSV